MYSKGFREAALMLYEKFQSMKKVSELLRISLSTIWSWLRNGIESKKRNPKPLSSQVVDFIRSLIEKTPWVVHRDLQTSLLKEFGITLSRQCIGSILRKLKITRKRLKFRGNANPERIHQRVLTFKEAYSQSRKNGNEILAVDECGFDFKCLPSYGYSKIGTKPIISSKSCSYRTRVSLVMGITSNGSCIFEFVEGTTNEKTFASFLRNQNASNKTILMDNCSIHKTKLVRETLLAMNQEPLYIPPYTPECNPIENVFAVIKNRFRKKLISCMGETKQYKEMLRDIIQNLDLALFKRCFDHMEAWLENYRKTL